MGTEALGPWEPLSVSAVAELFRQARFRWWLAGGYALEAHLASSWRAHDDIDVGVNRSDLPHLGDLLHGWDIHVAANGVLTRWDGQPLDDRADHAANNLWCRPSPAGPWVIDILVGDGDDRDWIYRRDPAVRRPWSETVLASADGVPYLAPEIQLLFKSTDMRPKDAVDAAEVVPLLEPDRRTWLANRLAAEHPWQTFIAGERARVAVRSVTGVGDQVELLSSGRSSQAWRTVETDSDIIVRVPIPNSGRLISYRSEVVIGDLLARAGHPVSNWRIESADDLACSIGTMLGGEPVEYDTVWSEPFAIAFAAVLRDLHRLPATGWGPLENQSGVLRGTSDSTSHGVVDRWFQARIWPFDGSDLVTHPITELEPDLAEVIAPLEREIRDAAGAPYGVVHSDLHNQHLLHTGGELTGVLDFGDAFIGSTAWDFALIRWYYGADNAQRFADAYGESQKLLQRGSALAIAVGCYKVAKSPNDETARQRLRSLLNR